MSRPDDELLDDLMNDNKYGAFDEDGMLREIKNVSKGDLNYYRNIATDTNHPINQRKSRIEGDD